MGCAERFALDAGARGRRGWDGGKAETDVGAELGGGFAYAHTKLGLGIEARGQYLLAHQKSAFDEWGASLTPTVDPGADKRGLWLALAPVWGADASQVEQMWGSAEVLRAGGETDTTPSLSPAQVEFDIGYGLVTQEGLGLLTTDGGLSMMGPHSHGVRLGGRIELSEWVDLSVEGERTTQGGGVSASPSAADDRPSSGRRGERFFAPMFPLATLRFLIFSLVPELVERSEDRGAKAEVTSGFVSTGSTN